MKLLCCHPGRFGDLLWALPTLRALHQAGHEVDLLIPEQYWSIEELVAQQDYIHAIYPVSHEDWPIQQTAPITPLLPRIAPAHFYDRVISLGYPGWPTEPLPYSTYSTVRTKHSDLEIAELDLETPWVRSSAPERSAPRVALGFTDEWFELKLGITVLLRAEHLASLLFATGSRWDHAAKRIPGYYTATSWDAAAQIVRDTAIFVGDCSALHVLAVALGKPCVIVEPNPQRHHPIFWPKGTLGQVELVLGNDGKPTFDARHVIEAIRERLKHL